MRRSGSRRAQPARSRSSATARRRSRSKAITTRCSSSTTSSPRSVTPYDVRLDGEPVWPPDDGRPQPVVHTRNHEPHVRLVFGSCRVGDPAADPPRRRRGPTTCRRSGSTRSGRTRSSCSGASSSGPTRCYCSATRSTRTRSRPERSSSSERRRGHRRAPGEQVADFEEYTQPLPRVVVGPGHPLAALDGAHHDDLRRPRRPRRLEHLVALGRGDARASRGGRRASPAPSWPTGSTSISATSRRPSSTQETTLRA